MADVNRYIGARYVPKFADPITWDDTRSYEALTIVTQSGASYTSKQPVPAGIPISNTDYWVCTGNYNAQIDAYREEVAEVASNMTEIEDALEVAQRDIVYLQEKDETFEQEFVRQDGLIQTAQQTATAANTAAGQAQSGVDTNTAAITSLDERVTDLEDNPQATTKNHIAFIGDSWADGSSECAAIVGQITGKTVINKAATGAGFVAGSYLFVDQLHDIIADPDFNDIDCIFVYGGINDWNDASATTSQMETAFTAFRNEYLSIPAADRPRMIFAFGNVGETTRAQYDGFLQWQRDCVRIARNLYMPGVVDNVCFWFCGLSAASVFESDRLHPSVTGQRIIASYLLSLYFGSYNGVYRQFKGTSSLGVYTTVTFNNGIVSMSVKGADIALPTTSGYNQIASVTNRQLMFGGDNSSAANQNFITSVPLGVYADSSGHTAQRQLVFNARNGNLYVQNIGTVSLFPSGTVNLDTVLCGMPIA